MTTDFFLTGFESGGGRPQGASILLNVLREC